MCLPSITLHSLHNLLCTRFIHGAQMYILILKTKKKIEEFFFVFAFVNENYFHVSLENQKRFLYSLNDKLYFNPYIYAWYLNNPYKPLHCYVQFINWLSIKPFNVSRDEMQCLGKFMQQLRNALY